MKYPWMPMYWGDFLANTMQLTQAQVGAYALLIAYAWENEGVIPRDPAMLMRITRSRPRHWKGIWDALQVYWTPIEISKENRIPGDPYYRVPLTQGYTNQRVMAELHKKAKISNERKGAAEQMLSKRPARAQQSTQQTVSPTSTSTQKEEKEEKGNGTAEPARSLASALTAGALAHSPPIPKPNGQPALPPIPAGGSYRDPGLDYRSPPRTKSTNVLQPLPEGQAVRGFASVRGPPTSRPATEEPEPPTEKPIARPGS